ncbi:MAG: hypothetical protein N3G21_08995 [Candidatus Hydrogenedentes bacterium]|nr:hypothetical protein [Candidatus Hydrogenedentota bacterium]
MGYYGKVSGVFLIFLQIVLSICSWSELYAPTNLTELEKPLVRREIKIPDIEEFKVLKSDFHMHSVFSDGYVWPDLRIIESWATGLDVIAITDHVEGPVSRPYLSGDDNTSYELAKGIADYYGILLVKGGEITKKQPYGHYNALFLNDVSLIDVEDPLVAIENAVKQGAFIQWNHPEWNTATRNKFEFQKKLLEKGYLHGVEISNGSEWYPYVLDWALENNLTLMSNSDLHGLIMGEFNLDRFQRPMTLVLARNRTLESVREALDNKRTIAWIGDRLGGKEEWLSKLFFACVKFGRVEIVNVEKNEGKVRVENISDIPWLFKFSGLAASGTHRLEPRTSSIIKTKGTGEVIVKVLNAWIGSEKNLEVKVTLE